MLRFPFWHFFLYLLPRMCNEASTSFRGSPHAASACVDRMFSSVGFPALVENRKRACSGSFASGVSAAGLEWLGSRARQSGGGSRASPVLGGTQAIGDPGGCFISGGGSQLRWYQGTWYPFAGKYSLRSAF